jgi:hypothetical protein
MYQVHDVLAVAAEIRHDEPTLTHRQSIEAAWLLMGELDIDPTSRYRPCRVVMFSREESYDNDSSTDLAA